MKEHLKEHTSTDDMHGKWLASKIKNNTFQQRNLPCRNYTALKFVHGL